MVLQTLNGRARDAIGLIRRRSYETVTVVQARTAESAWSQVAYWSRLKRKPGSPLAVPGERAEVTGAFRRDLAGTRW